MNVPLFQALTEEHGGQKGGGASHNARAVVVKGRGIGGGRGVMGGRRGPGVCGCLVPAKKKLGDQDEGWEAVSVAHYMPHTFRLPEESIELTGEEGGDGEEEQQVEVSWQEVEQCVQPMDLNKDIMGDQEVGPGMVVGAEARGEQFRGWKAPGIRGGLSRVE
ncbi:hypothetical protein NDU88_004600 [Pleurodeles waltl]|uniref:Uncharacterized protein n=1 Tax=Pleurodeles waltl TaxID=8319 RepID=A0AAV7WV56_PLEWA|nr:hypothetical protein NDU88_004600 [Pleurodeles waltl]